MIHFLTNYLYGFTHYDNFNCSKQKIVPLIKFNYVTYFINKLYYYLNLIDKKHITFNNNDILICNICMEQNKNHVFIPCGHLVCLKCSRYFSDCPFCRCLIQKKL
jgi:hypothetical protein